MCVGGVCVHVYGQDRLCLYERPQDVKKSSVWKLQACAWKQTGLGS